MFFVGGYGPDLGGSAHGIGRAELAPDGSLRYLGSMVDVPSPSWIGQHGDVVFALAEGLAELFSFRLTRSGSLELARSVPTTGSLPSHAAISRGHLLVASFGNGDVSAHPLDSDGTALAAVQTIEGTGRGPMPVQSGPRAHHVLVLANGAILTADLGADCVHVYDWLDVPGRGRRLVRTGSVPLVAGTGPRDLLELPGGRVAVLGELACTIHLLEPRGATFVVGGRVDLPSRGNGAGLALSDDGRYIYAAVRGPNRIATVQVFRDSISVVADTPTFGHWPRYLMVDGNFLHVANQRSDSVASFQIGADGMLTLRAQAAVPSPAWLLRVA